MRDEGRAERWAVAVLLGASLLLDFVGLRWGLPNDDGIWSTDALTPMAPLAAAYRLIGSGWNSGWFYYKYPLGHPLLLAVVYAPYLALLKLTGGLGHASSDYPYGFTDPSQSLFVLALLGRAVSAAMTTGAVLFWYLACRELLGWRRAWLAAWFLATAFPVVFYAHTTNVDAALLFWCSIAVYGAARVFTREGDRLGMLVFGAAASMALSTKEYALGLMVSLALLMFGRQLMRRRASASAPWLPPGWLAGLALSIAVFVVMNGIVVNPLGMWHRVLFLTDSMPESLRLEYAPRFSHVGSASLKDSATEIAQLLSTLRESADSIGWAAALAAGVGLIFFGWRLPGLFFALAALGYYFASLRSLEMLQVRYVLPLSMLATALAAQTVGALAQASSRRLGAAGGLAIAGAFAVYSAACGLDATRLLLADTRYQAEAWMAANAREASVEVYQREAYLPRFLPTQEVDRVEFDEVSTTAFLSRQPEIVVLSSAGLAGVTVRFKNDLAGDGDEGERTVSKQGASGEAMAYEYTRNRNFLDALEKGCLGYELAAHFESSPWLAKATVPSLAPTIRVYRRTPGAAVEGGSETCRQLRSAAG